MLDSRNKRGQRHNLAFVLTSFLMAVLGTTGHLDLSCIHRRMVKEHDLMVKDTAYKALRCISYVQLGRVLDSIDYGVHQKMWGKC